jgi:hypothetical protein
MPKSSTFTIPPSVIITLAGLMSRCTMSTRCTSASTAATWATIAAAHPTEHHGESGASGGKSS